MLLLLFALDISIFSQTPVEIELDVKETVLVEGAKLNITRILSISGYVTSCSA